jgi:hypothetical protein
VDSQASTAAAFGPRTPKRKRNPHWSFRLAFCIARYVLSQLYAGPHTFGLVLVDRTHLDEIFDLEFAQARGPAIPEQLDTSLA